MCALCVLLCVSGVRLLYFQCAVVVVLIACGIFSDCVLYVFCDFFVHCWMLLLIPGVFFLCFLVISVCFFYDYLCFFCGSDMFFDFLMCVSGVIVIAFCVIITCCWNDFYCFLN